MVDLETQQESVGSEINLMASIGIQVSGKAFEDSCLRWVWVLRYLSYIMEQAA